LTVYLCVRVCWFGVQLKAAAGAGVREVVAGVLGPPLTLSLWLATRHWRQPRKKEPGLMLQWHARGYRRLLGGSVKRPSSQGAAALVATGTQRLAWRWGLGYCRRLWRLLWSWVVLPWLGTTALC
jgi:hypothetical protein